jgi:hypothetical protein
VELVALVARTLVTQEYLPLQIVEAEVVEVFIQIKAVVMAVQVVS